MKRAINVACFAGIGFVLATGGITLVDWQLWAALFLASTASIASEVME